MGAESEIEIKNRMIKKAASLWGVSANEIESSFDPLVSLLIGACASEIEKISNEIDSSQVRVTERLIQLMTPETIYGAKPAHGIVYSEPVEKVLDLTPEHLQYYKKKIRVKNAGQELKNIYFSSVQKFRMVDASITHMICGDKGYVLEGKKKSDFDLSFKSKKKLPFSVLYIGIETSYNKLNLKDVSLYNELLDVYEKELFYHHLKNAEFFFDNQEIKTIAGYSNSEISARDHLNSIFEYKPNKTRNIEGQIKTLYEKHFVSFKSDVLLSNKGSIPDDLSEIVDFEAHEELQKLNWIKIVFPRIIDDNILENAFCSLNAFPALNRKWEHISYQLKDYIDIVPISTQDLFLDVKQIANTSGIDYKLRESDTSEDHKGTYVIRRDNVGKLDSRKAKEYLAHLIELLKSESASFSFFGNDFLQSNIDELNQNISLLEKKIMDMNTSLMDTTYLSVKPKQKKDTLLIEYWVTNGEEANQIKQGNSLHIYQGSDLKQNKSVFLTTTFQGKNDLSMEERLQAYRRALLSRNRIVTKEDVKALCYEFCGERIEEVKVVKGFKTSIEIHKGLVPCMEIIIQPNKEVMTLDEEWSSLKSNILSILEQQSLNVFPYKITVLN